MILRSPLPLPPLIYPQSNDRTWWSRSPVRTYLSQNRRSRRRRRCTCDAWSGMPAASSSSSRSRSSSEHTSHIPVNSRLTKHLTLVAPTVVGNRVEGERPWSPRCVDTGVDRLSRAVSGSEDQSTMPTWSTCVRSDGGTLGLRSPRQFRAQ